MSTYDDKRVENKDCNNFQAGSHLRSKRKNAKLSVTGVFGISCRHPKTVSQHASWRKDWVCSINDE